MLSSETIPSSDDDAKSSYHYLSKKELSKFGKSWFLRVSVAFLAYPLEPPRAKVIKNPSMNLKDLGNIYKGYFSKGFIGGVRSVNAGVFSSALRIALREPIRLGLIEANNRMIGPSNDNILDAALKTVVLSSGDVLLHSFDTVRVRVSQEKERRISYKEVLRSGKLYNGILGTLSKSMTHWGVLLVLDSYIKNVIMQVNNLEENESLNNLQKTEVAISKSVVASVFTFPSETIKMVLQGVSPNLTREEKYKAVKKVILQPKVLGRAYLFRLPYSVLAISSREFILNFMKEGIKDKQSSLSR